MLKRRGCNRGVFIRVGILCLLLETGPGMLAQMRVNSFSDRLFEAFRWRLIGPAMPGGRAWQVVGDPKNPKTFYVCTAGGGLWKTQNNGTTLVPIFEQQTSASTGAVAIAPSDSRIVWLGTGEPASTRANSWGDGVYRSTDGGLHWEHRGLLNTRQISAIVIHPENPETVWVAAMGFHWGQNQERGIFVTQDGGRSWKQSLSIDDLTGCIDLQGDPKDPDTLYAAAWQRIRWGGGDMQESGAGSGIFKTTDGGRRWVRLQNGLPSDSMGKIQLAVGRRNSRRIYAAVLTGEPSPGGGRTSNQGGIFRSDDAGSSWKRVNPTMTSYYYQHLVVDPGNDDHVWMPGFELMRSVDGGATFAKVNTRHVHNDLHALWINPKDPDQLVLGGDGGVSISYDRGSSWQQTVLPIGQFYEVSVDTQDPYFVYGGMQDTGHWTGPSRTYDNEGITNHDWIKLRHVGDGMAIHADPGDPNLIYMVQQFGNLSRLDLRTGDRVELTPDPQEAQRRGMPPFRYDWTPPLVLSHHDPGVLYFGSNYLFRMGQRGEKWEIISPDLSWQQDRILQGKTDGYHSYGALFSIAESRLDRNLLWVGADDGPLHVTRDGGKSWTRVDGSLPLGAPARPVVAEIEASRFDAGTAYVVLDAHTCEDLRPYVYRTRDYGHSWHSVSGNLPENGSAYVIRESPGNPNVLFVGTEFGVFFTFDGGKDWIPLRNNLPTVAVRTMAIQDRDRELVAGTFGRGIWIIDIAPLEELTQDILNGPVHLFPIKPGTLFKTRFTYGTGIEELNGDMFFRAENPPFGTALTYYLKQSLPAQVRLIVQDPLGKVLRTLSGPGEAGIHRITWDLKREPPSSEEEIRRARAVTPSEKEALDRVVPGLYLVTLEAGPVRKSRQVVVRSEPQGMQQSPARL